MKRLFLVLGLILMLNLASSLDCPFGLTDDPYPGSCARYVDSNKDGLCDLSEQEIEPVAKTEVKETSLVGRYYLIPIVLLSVFLYILSFVLQKKQKVSLFTHRKIWNLLLLISFVLVAITSVFLVIRLEYGTAISFPVNLTFWHIEIGIVMILISIFHALWHIKYYKSYLRKAE